MHVSSSSLWPDQFRSDATCGSKSPREVPQATNKPMAAGDNGFRANGFERAQHRDFDLQFGISSLRTGANRESFSAALIAERATTSARGPAFSICPTQPRRLPAQYIADECPAGLGKCGREKRKFGDTAFKDGAGNRVAGDFYKSQPIVTGQSGHPEHSCAVREFSGGGVASRCRRHGPRTSGNIETRKPPRFQPPATAAARQAGE